MKSPSWCRLLVLLGLACLQTGAHAAQTHYVYDELGRLVQATRSDGPVVQYIYDGNGNLLAVNRHNGSSLVISTFTPTITQATSAVVISGSGFSAIPSENHVLVGGAPAAVLAASTTQLSITVPMAAQSGVISVTVGSNTALSAQAITVRRPAIHSFTPKVVNPGGTVTITGNYFTLLPGTFFAAGSQNATTSSLTQTSAQISAPNGGSGFVRVISTYGEALSAEQLYVVPAAIPANTVDSWNVGTVAGAAVPLSISGGNRRAVMAFDGEPNQRLSLQLDSFVATPASLTISYILYSPTGSQLYTSNLSNADKTSHFPTLGVAGRYLVVFTSVASNSSLQFTARLEHAIQLGTDGVPAVVSTSVPGQERQIRFTATAGEVLSFATYGVAISPTSVSNVTVTIDKPGGDEVLFFRGYRTQSPGNTSQLESAPVTGTYNVYIKPDGLATMNLSFRVARPSTGSLVAGTPGTAIPVSAPLNGDIAWFSFTAQPTDTLALHVSSQVTTPANKSVWLKILDPTGAQISTTASLETSQTVNLRNIAGGEYHAMMYTQNAEKFTANLSLANGVVMTLPADGTSTPINTWVKGQNAYLKFPATAGQDLTYTTLGLTMTPASGSLETTIKRPGGTTHYDGYALRTNTPGTQLHFMDLPSTGNYSVTLVPTEHVRSALNLRIAPMVAGTIVPGDPAQALSLPAQGDAALLEFTIAAPRNVTVNATSIATSPSNRSVRVEVFNANGTSVGSNQGQGTSRTVNMTSLVAGTYRVHISTQNAATATMQVRIP